MLGLCTCPRCQVVFVVFFPSAFRFVFLFPSLSVKSVFLFSWCQVPCLSGLLLLVRMARFTIYDVSFDSGVFVLNGCLRMCDLESVIHWNVLW